MRRQKRTKQLSAAVAIYLSLNIQVQDEHGPDWMLAIPVLPLNFWLWWGWQTQVIVKQIHRSVTALLDRYGQRLVSFSQGWGLVMTLLGIGCKASLYGLGVRI